MASPTETSVPESPPPATVGAPNQDLTHPAMAALDKEAILRQVEHYFSDENLQSDAHLLGKLEEGNGTVSISHLLSFPRMHKYKPRSAVREILKESNVVELVENNKRIRRRTPFDISKARVVPRVNRDEEATRRKAILAANPHLTKSMLKPTGFERDHVEPALSAEEKQTALEEFSPEIPFCDRIETAVLRYKMNRKLHQETARILHTFLEYGGFDQRPPMFTGGASKEELEGLSKEEKARRKQISFVSEQVRESLEAQDGRWTVDFDGVLKGFFSTYFQEKFLLNESTSRQRDKDVTKGACNIFRNFFNYLLHQGVCTEYADQILAARASLDVVESEYPRLADFQQVFPGDFNVACSTLLKGHHYQIQYRGDWMTPEEAATHDPGFTPEEAIWIANAGVAAFANQDHLDAATPNPQLAIISTEDNVGLEITTLIPPAGTSSSSQDLFAKLASTIVPRMGKVICHRYHFPNAAPSNTPPNSPDVFEFILDEKTLAKCYPGIKFVATVVETNVGIHFIDHWAEVSGTFYTWCWNDKRTLPKGWGRARRRAASDSQEANADSESVEDPVPEGDPPFKLPKDFPEIVVQNIEEQFSGENLRLNAREVSEATEMDVADSSLGAHTDKKGAASGNHDGSNDDQKRKDSAAVSGSHSAERQPSVAEANENMSGDEGFFSDEEDTAADDG
ncbi:hypothetical protein WHR41_08150 [Cladosporium halotolerans]|uniref:HTH La-type RNA-binding domain-containing protein n=1 Tax=Cladosporium halotolerans TaxID=1052096 RepID=A0AB34KJR4_9PEZI